MIKLSENAGLALGQIHKLENDRVKKVNPAHLAALAGPLQLSIFHLYQAAGYPVDNLYAIEQELVERLRDLSPDALRSVTDLVDRLTEDDHIDGRKKSGTTGDERRRQ